MTKWLWLAAGVGLIVGGVWLDRGWCNHACSVARSQRDTLQAKLDELDRQAIAQRERWAQATAAEELKARKDESDRKKRFAELRAKAKPAPVSDGTRKLLGDAYQAAHAAEASGPSTGTAPANAPPSGLEEWAVDMYAWAAVCAARVGAWESWYNSLRGTDEQGL